MIQRAAHTRVRAAAVAAYSRRRSERDAVRTGYPPLAATTAFGEPRAVEAYQSALDRDERAADTFARLMSRLRHPAETDPAHQKALTQALSGTWERR